MNNQTNHRKIEHIKVIEKDPATDRKAGYFDRIHLMHKALPEISLDDVDPSTVFLGKRISFPLMISSMTGGEHELLKKINHNLAAAAEKMNVAMATGSQRVLFENPKANESFDLRSVAPSIPLIGNIGAVQLNYGFTINHCRQAVDILAADGLYLHLNSLQEAIQPEGNTNFSNLLNKIKDIQVQLSVPVLIKEVGCGIGPREIGQLKDIGISYIDIAGQGGTSWSRIESQRNPVDDHGIAFQDWGIPTPLALKLAHQYSDDLFIIASGGLRNGLDMVKSVIMGAQLCGLAAPFLKAAMHSSGHVVKEIQSLKHAFTIAMFLTGTKNIDELRGNSQLILENID